MSGDVQQRVKRILTFGITRLPYTVKMAGVSMEKVLGVMKNREMIRNVAIIGGTNSGIMTVMDTLNKNAGLCLTSDEGYTRYVVDPMVTNLTCLYHTCSPINLQHMEAQDGNTDFVLNVMDTPGSVDFSAEVDTTLRTMDGVVVMVDCLSGISLDTWTVLRQAIKERVKPVLFINNIDRVVQEHKLSQEDLYQSLYNVTEAAKGVIATYSDESGPMGSIQFDPVKGNVLFGSAGQGWGVTLREAAAAHAAKLKMAPNELLGKLWGDNFYSPSKKKWKKEGSKGYIRAFNMFVLDPIFKVFETSENVQGGALPDLIESIGVQLTIDNNESNSKKRLQSVMGQWLPITNSLLTMVVLHVPSPIKAQGYRTEILLKPKTDEVVCTAVKMCDPRGPLVLHVSKWIRVERTDTFYGIGRVFSGSVISGSEIEEPQRKTAISEISIIAGNNICPVPEVQCGNVCVIRGIEQRIAKTGTLSTHTTPVLFTDIRYSVSPIVYLDVEPRNPADAPNVFVELKKLMKLHPVLECSIGASGLHTLTGSSEHLMLRCRTYLDEKVGIKPNQPHTAYCETITEEPAVICTSVCPKTPKNELSIKTIPLPNGLCECIDEGFVSADMEPAKRATYLARNFGYNASEFDRLWCFGPSESGPNLLYDSCKQSCDLSHVKDGIIAGFRWATREGILCEEKMRGVQADLRYANWKLTDDSDIVKATRRATHGSIIASSPRLMEPISLVEVTCAQGELRSVTEALTNRQGRLLKERRVGWTPNSIVKCFVPGENCLGIADELSSRPTCVVQVAFHHWEIMNDDPLEPDSAAAAIAMATRVRKGLPADIPGAHASSA